MLTSALPVAVLGAASYSDELQGAYDYALSKEVTTMDSIDNANMYGGLIRSHMAKMMSNWATSTLGLTPDTSKDCNFTDVADESPELQNSITEACQLGLMGVGITEFRPGDSVTRAEFGTVLSRAIWGTANDGGTPYYADHLAALKDAGIMNDISNPDQLEVRGYVMLMMQRADESGVANVGCSAEELLACVTATNYDACVAACSATTPTEPTEVKAGSLSVELGNALANGTEVPMVGVIKFASVDFSASSSDVSLKTVELKKVGLASIPTSTRVWFEKDGIRVSGKASFTSEGVAVVSFAPAFVVKANNTETLDLYVDLSTTAGQDFQFASQNVDSTAVNVNGSFTTPKLRTASYTVANLAISAQSATGTANVTTNGMELGAFKLDNTVYTGSETRDVNFKSITLRQNGSASLSNLADIVLERNGAVVASNPKIDGRNVTFTVNDVIKNATSATYYIKATVNNVETSSDTYQFELRNTTDLNAAEVLTDFRSSVSSTVSLYTYTIQGGELTFARDASYPLSANYAAGSDVVLMKGTIKANNGTVTLEDPSIYLSSASTQTTGLNNTFTTLYLQIGSSVFSYSPTATDTGALFVGAATVNGTVNVKLYGKIRDTAAARTVKFNDLSLSSFRLKEYSSNGVTVTTSVGNIAAIAVTAQVGTLNVTRTDALGDTNMAAGSQDVTLYGLRLSSTQGNGVTLSRVILNITGNNSSSTGYATNGTLTLYVNGVAVSSTKTITSSNTVTFDSFTKQITTTSPLDLVVKGSFSEAFSAGSIKLTLNSLNVYDTLTSNTISSYSTPAGAVFTVNTAVGTFAASNNNPVASLLLSPSVDQKVVAFKMTATNDNVRLYTLVVTGAGIDYLSNFRLVDLSGTVIAPATTVTSSTITFSEIASAPVVAKDTSANYYVIADVNSNSNYGPINLTVDVSASTVKGTNGLAIAAAGSDVASRTHAVSQNVFTLAKASNSNKAITTSALRFTVTAAGKDNILLTGVTLNNALAGYTGTVVVKVYKSSISSVNEAGTFNWNWATSNGADIVVPMTSNSNVNSIIDAGSTVEYIVALEGTLVNSASTSTDWNVTLKNLYFGGLQATSYNNLGTLPMTEVK